MLAEPSYQKVEELEVLLNAETKRNLNKDVYHRYQNFWYALATIKQDQTSSDAINPHARIENRQAWNRYMCGDLPDKEKEILSNSLNLTDRDFDPFTESDWQDLEVCLEKCSNSYALKILRAWKKPSQCDRPIIDFNNVEFDARILFDGFIFNGIAKFSNSLFARETSFSNACFLKRVDFSEVIFRAPVDFEGAKFMGNVDYTRARFDYRANFQNSEFRKTVVFKGATFNDSVDFSNAEFSGTTSFHKTDFKKIAPFFFNSKLYEDTILSTEEGLWPNTPSINSENHERAYARLRRYMTDIKKPDEEMFFHKLEMREKSSSQGRASSFMIKAYDRISVFGQSIYRPMGGLVGLILFGAILFWACDNSKTPVIDRLMWSISNSIPLVRLSSIVKPSDISSFLRLYSVFQSIGSSVLIFLTLLAVRNKFRIK